MIPRDAYQLESANDLKYACGRGGRPIPVDGRAPPRDVSSYLRFALESVSKLMSYNVRDMILYEVVLLILLYEEQ